MQLLTHKKKAQTVAGKSVIYYARKEKIAARVPFLVDKTVTNQVTSTGRHTATPSGPNWKRTLLPYWTARQPIVSPKHHVVNVTFKRMKDEVQWLNDFKCDIPVSESCVTDYYKIPHVLFICPSCLSCADNRSLLYFSRPDTIYNILTFVYGRSHIACLLAIFLRTDRRQMESLCRPTHKCTHVNTCTHTHWKA